MTQEYIVGEVSVLLARLEAVAPERGPALAELRHAAESRPVARLGSVVTHALELVDVSCWESLQWGDAAGFARRAETSADLRGFAVCAGLLADQICG